MGTVVDPVSLLHRARTAGLRVEAQGDRLVITGSRSGEPIVQLISRHKEQVLAAIRKPLERHVTGPGVTNHPAVAAVLGRFPGAQVIAAQPVLAPKPSIRNQQPEISPHSLVAEMEALATTSAGTPTDCLAWTRAAESLSKWLAGPPRGACTPKRWAQFVQDAYQATMDGWVARALAHGWRLDELLGCHRLAPWSRYDCMGLLPLLNGLRISELSGAGAILETPLGARQSFTRGQAVGDVVFIWDASV